MGSEYDVVSFKPRPGVVSLLCAVIPIAFGMFADDLPFALGGRLRPYYGHIFLASVGLCLAGIAFGVYASRRPEYRGTGRLGILVNGIVLVLLSLFMLIFRWIRYGSLSWF